ncbi:PBP1A family penicillin-binding protein [Rummeliibacillus sp. TYF005]|uniref:PBP1A family penicillin-binding protein n=1 Tax=Rummeliibacillus sp. TYF005 TaxID=2058214 RepID=UPI000F54ACF3|nr:PBP1A family penicillin-binding protein [Rummeliibacillus sp. TYF005]RPJ95707.1 PBP1A family penicillin-binding protein [Rummeliibacillus sp. TYF005]
MDQQINSRRQRKQLEEQQRKRHTKKKGPKGPKGPNRSWIKKIIIAILAIGIAMFAIGGGVFAFYAAQAPKLDEELLKDPVSSKFFDNNGKVFYTMGDQEREHVAYEDIPTSMRDAIIATEDSRFFQHHGIDFVRLGGAVLANFRFGFGSQGGSTLTQQVIKNSFLNNGKTLKRKAQEAYLAVQLEREYSKEEIFEMYFNKVLMSGRIYGFGTAAKFFYGKNLKDLTLAQQALLAGMPQAPNAYNPFKNPDRAEKRRNIVLGLMYQHKKITKEQMEAAKKVDVAEGLLPENKRKTASSSKYDAFIDVVLKELEENGDEKALADGVNVYTTLDTSAQKIVEKTMNNDANFPTKDIQAGLSVIDTETGAIVAVGGGRDYGPERGFNYAEALTNRQPGSTMKPLMDYGPAIENLKWSTGQTIVDEPMTYTGTNQQINNFDHQYKGTITIRQALYNSRNIPAVKTFKEVGADKAKSFVKNLGINASNVTESDAIGGGKINLSPIEMAGAYAAFGNNGIYTKPHAIKKIVYRDGKTAKSYTPDPVPAMSDYTAYMVTDMLRDVVSSKFGASGTAAGIAGLDVAGKTGTTNYSSDDFSKWGLPESSVPDSWFAGYTSKYSIAVWSGYTNYKNPITTSAERVLPQQLFRTVMSQISANTETPDFTQPNSVVRVGSELYVKGQQPVTTKPEETTDEEQKVNAPSGLKATYDANSNAINLTWSHEATNDEKANFKISVSVDGGGSQALTETSSNSYTYSGAESGKTYVFSVVAIAGGKTSSAATTSIQIQASEPEPEPDVTEPDQTETPTTPDQSETPTTPSEGNDQDNTNTDQNDQTTENSNQQNNQSNNGNGNGKNKANLNSIKRNSSPEELESQQ